MSALFSRPRPRGPRVHSIISTPPEVWAFELTYLMTAPTDEAYQKAIGAIAQTMAQPYSPRRQDIIYNQLRSLVYWRDRLQAPQKKPGRGKGSYRETDAELYKALTEGFRALRRQGETPRTITQEKLLYAMGRSKEDPKRIREARDRLLFLSWPAMKKHFYDQSPT